ncbi:Probable protein phosphatase 2C 47 [Striga hermonthica]|uniref:protein-serine/threonine phosphatase n=1 Tax=Striga hermonthica TaxID=68872 RepID=A0A9N7NQC3_STRHE|nr:Probable protein phosphatase 2C 47 [Striga hermonthica]
MGPGANAAACQGKSNGFHKENEKLSNYEKIIEEERADTIQPTLSRPPLMRHCISQASLANSYLAGCPIENGVKSSSGKDSEYSPIFRSGSCSEMGPKPYMEDEFICVDNLSEHLGSSANGFTSPGAFYGVFDGHGGTDAASFTKKNILNFIVEDLDFPHGMKRALKNAFVKADHALADAKNLDRSSGTTALTALMLGRKMIIANAGDSRAVLGKRGRAVELSKDHKPECTSERARIEKLGGVIYDGVSKIASLQVVDVTARE